MNTASIMSNLCFIEVLAITRQAVITKVQSRDPVFMRGSAGQVAARTVTDAGPLGGEGGSKSTFVGA